MENKIYYTPITYETVLRKHNWKQGGNACTFMSDNKDMSFKIEVNMYGKTKKEATEKLIRFLSAGGIEIEVVPADSGF